MFESMLVVWYMLIIYSATWLFMTDGGWVSRWKAGESIPWLEVIGCIFVPGVLPIVFVMKNYRRMRTERVHRLMGNAPEMEPPRRDPYR